jgi:hypothetical protein
LLLGRSGFPVAKKVLDPAARQLVTGWGKNRSNKSGDFFPFYQEKEKGSQAFWLMESSPNVTEEAKKRLQRRRSCDD